MKTLLKEIDELFAHLEDFTHGEDGEDITKMRGKIETALNQRNKTLKEELIKFAKWYQIEEMQRKEKKKFIDIIDDYLDSTTEISENNRRWHN